MNPVFEGEARKDSKFWNEGKWNNFIKPLLPNKRMSFLEIGCNAGLFLKMARDSGFRDITGIEGNKDIMMQAKIFKEQNRLNYKLVEQAVDEKFEVDNFPVVDVVVLSNFHYYLPIGVFSRLVDRIKSRTRYCIVVSAKAKRRKGNALHYIDSPGIRGYFKNWEELKTIENIDKEGDILPREDMYGILFKGDLDTVDIDGIIERGEYREHSLYPAIEEFFGKVLNKEVFDYDKTLFYDFWEKRESRLSHDQICKILDKKKAIALDIQKNGMKTPVYLSQEGGMLDGAHRMCIAKLLDYKHLIVRKI